METLRREGMTREIVGPRAPVAPHRTLCAGFLLVARFRKCISPALQRFSGGDPGYGCEG